MELDLEIISTAILLPSADSRMVVVSYKRKYIREALANRLPIFEWQLKTGFSVFTIETFLFEVPKSFSGDTCILPGTVVQSVHISYDKWGHVPPYPLNCIHVTCIHHIKHVKK